jgi:putative ubiquitin-RnfH superfamily antitoxin RatB of RatAB toxin-antitoxin module
VRIELVYAAATAVTAVFELEGSATVADVLRLAAQDPRFGALDLANAPVGIFGQSAARTQALADGDRLEIYRPLVQDPKIARRRRAASGPPTRGKSLNKSGRS